MLLYNYPRGIFNSAKLHFYTRYMVTILSKVYFSIDKAIKRLNYITHISVLGNIEFDAL